MLSKNIYRVLRKISLIGSYHLVCPRAFKIIYRRLEKGRGGSWGGSCCCRRLREKARRGAGLGACVRGHVAIRGKERQLGRSFEKRLGFGCSAKRAWVPYGCRCRSGFLVYWLCVRRTESSGSATKLPAGQPGLEPCLLIQGTWSPT
jgi:hypothetical protein